MLRAPPKDKRPDCGAVFPAAPDGAAGSPPPRISARSRSVARQLGLVPSPRTSTASRGIGGGWRREYPRIATVRRGENAGEDQEWMVGSSLHRCEQLAADVCPLIHRLVPWKIALRGPSLHLHFAIVSICCSLFSKSYKEWLSRLRFAGFPRLAATARQMVCGIRSGFR